MSRRLGHIINACLAVALQTHAHFLLLFLQLQKRGAERDDGDNLGHNESGCLPQLLVFP